ncbi:MAG: hypothetical protein AAGE01_00555 [Pseudomonadota bacterium]
MKAQRLAATMLFALTAPLAVAGPSGSKAAVMAHAERCFAQTELAARGDATPTPVWCSRALSGDVSREQRSILLHNRGLILEALGDSAGARQSFETAVRLSRSTDMRNLALARAAHETGDYAQAIGQYTRLLSAEALAPSLMAQRPLLERKLASAQACRTVDERLSAAQR